MFEQRPVPARHGHVPAVVGSAHGGEGVEGAEVVAEVAAGPCGY